MNQHMFTAAMAEQHRAQLMASARHARDCRAARSARPGMRWRMWARPVPQTTARPAASPARLADAV